MSALKKVRYGKIVIQFIVIIVTFTKNLPAVIASNATTHSTYATVQEALTAVAHNQTVVVLANTTENLTIANATNVTIIGNGTMPLITGSGTDQGLDILSTCRNIKVVGLTFSNNINGIKSVSPNHIISNCVFYNHSRTFDLRDGAHNCVITDNKVFNNTNTANGAFQFGVSTNNIVRNNFISNSSGYNIWLAGSKNSAIGNTIVGGKQGFRLSTTSGHTIVSNTIAGQTEAGIYFSSAPTDILVVRNLIRASKWGIQVTGSSANVNIFNNTILKETATEDGISIESTASANIANNILSGYTSGKFGFDYTSTSATQTFFHFNLFYGDSVAYTNIGGSGNVVRSNNLFGNPILNSVTFRISTNHSPAVDSGKNIAGVTDLYLGVAPDIGWSESPWTYSAPPIIASNATTHATYTTVQAALSAVAHNQTVVVLRNTTENLMIANSTNVTITGNGTMPVITGSGTDQGLDISSSCRNIKVVGLTFSNNINGILIASPFHIISNCVFYKHSRTFDLRDGTHNCLITDNKIYNNYGVANGALQFGISTNNIVKNNLFSNSVDRNIWVGGTKNIFIKNTIVGGKQGFRLSTTSGHTIVSNTITGQTEAGIHFYNTPTEIVVARNLIQNSKVGIQLINSASQIEIYNNTLQRGSLGINGIEMSGTADALIVNNIIYDYIAPCITYTSASSRITYINNNLLNTTTDPLFKSGTGTMLFGSYNFTGNPQLDLHNSPEVQSMAIDRGAVISDFSTTYGGYLGNAPDMGWKETAFSAATEINPLWGTLITPSSSDIVQGTITLYGVAASLGEQTGTVLIYTNRYSELTLFTTGLVTNSGSFRFFTNSLNTLSLPEDENKIILVISNLSGTASVTVTNTIFVDNLLEFYTTGVGPDIQYTFNDNLTEERGNGSMSLLGGSLKFTNDTPSGIGKSLVFGRDSYYQNNHSFDHKEGTLFFWFKNVNSAATCYIVFHVNGEGDGNNRLYIGYHDNKAFFAFKEWANEIVGATIDNNWHAWTAVWENGLASFYLDGTLQGTHGYDTSSWYPKGSFTHDRVEKEVGGFLEEFQMYPWALSPLEINRLVNFSTNAMYDNLIIKRVVASNSAGTLFPRVQTAIYKASTGQTIFLLTNINEKISINNLSQVTLTGKLGNNDTSQRMFSGNGSGTAIVLESNAIDITISHLTFKNYEKAISVKGLNHHIENNLFENNQQTIRILEGTSQINVVSNVIRSQTDTSFAAIEIGPGIGTYLRNNIISNSFYAIRISGKDGYVAENIVRSCENGIEIKNSVTSQIVSNAVYNAVGDAFSISESGINNIVAANLFHTFSNGIMMNGDAVYTKLFHNTIVSESGKGVGMIAAGGSHFFAENNILSGNFANGTVLLFTSTNAMPSKLYNNIIFNASGEEHSFLVVTNEQQLWKQNNIYKNPLLTTSYLLEKESPAIDNGKFLEAWNVNFSHTGPDIGWREYTDDGITELKERGESTFLSDTPYVVLLKTKGVANISLNSLYMSREFEQSKTISAVLTDISGKVIREEEPFDSSGNWIWDFSDQKGNTVSVGIYFLFLIGDKNLPRNYILMVL